MQTPLPQFQRHQLEVIARVTPHSMAAHLLNTTVMAIAVAGSVPRAQLIFWCVYSYLIALLILYRHVRSRGRVPRNLSRAARRATVYAFLLSLPWSAVAVLYLGSLPQDKELVLVALVVGMAASGTILLSALPFAAFAYMSGVLVPSAIKCLVFLNQAGYLLLGVLAVSYWWFLAALIAKITREIAERNQAEEELHKSERKFRELLGALPAAIYETDAAGGITYCNQAAVDLWGTRPRLGEDKWFDLSRLYHGDGTPMIRADCPTERALKHGHIVRNMECVLERPDGTRTPIMPYPTPLRDEDGHIVGIVNMTVDISERKRAEDQQRVLVAELDHRVKNVLATVTAIVTQTRNAGNSVTDFVTALDSRIKSLARTHELLSLSRWSGVSLEEIARREFAPYAADNVEIGGPSVTLKAEAAQAMAMVLHELTTNAAKYGAFSDRNGRVSLRWRRLLNGPDNRLAIDWQEIGGPPVRAPSQSSYGTEIVRELIPFELGGTAELAFAGDGVRCRMEIPTEWISSVTPLNDAKELYPAQT
jgi:PAS domain S-box-containing protein